MQKQYLKLLLFFGITIALVSYVGWVFYISEPTYIDNNYKKVEKFDYVSIPSYKYYSDANTDVENGIVLQVDSTKAIVKTNERYSPFVEIDLASHNYRIIGKGTIYHKVNSYVGFNVMLITQLCIAMLALVVGFVLFSSLFKILSQYVS